MKCSSQTMSAVRRSRLTTPHDVVADRLVRKAGHLRAIEVAVGAVNRFLPRGQSDKAHYWFQVVSILFRRRFGGPNQDIILMESALHRNHLDTAQLWMRAARFRLRAFEARLAERALTPPDSDTQRRVGADDRRQAQGRYQTNVRLRQGGRRS